MCRKVFASWLERTISALKLAGTPCMDDRQSSLEDFHSTEELAQTCAQIALRCVCVWPELEDLTYFGWLACWHDQSPSGTKLVTQDWHDWQGTPMTQNKESAVSNCSTDPDIIALDAAVENGRYTSISIMGLRQQLVVDRPTSVQSSWPVVCTSGRIDVSWWDCVSETCLRPDVKENLTLVCNLVGYSSINLWNGKCVRCATGRSMKRQGASKRMEATCQTCLGPSSHATNWSASFDK